jgi:hypothetical protein
MSGKVLLVSCIALLAVRATVPSTIEDPLLDAGVRQTRDGDFEGAVLTLDAVARDLAKATGRSKDLARAYLFLGVAYLGLGQEALARARFLQALQQEPGLRLSPEEFSPKVIRAFEASRRARGERETLEKQARRKRGKGGLILLGIGGAGAAGVALAVTRERPNTVPSATITIAPEGDALADVTTLAFSASGSDPDGDPVSYRWAFGDGQSADGPVVAHLYRNPGSYAAVLTASDGLAATTVTRTVRVGSVTGRWRFTGETFLGMGDVDLRQGARGVLNGTFSPEIATRFGGLVTDPRGIVVSYQGDCNVSGFSGPCECSFRFLGETDATLRSMVGTLSCNDGHQTCRRCRGQTQAITLARQ